MTTPSIRPQPLVCVSDVPRSSAWYQALLGGDEGHGGEEYGRVLVDGVLVLQLHSLVVDHHHGPLADPGVALGNGVAVWFEAADFDGSVARARALGAHVVTDVHVNPNSANWELWLRDPDGYLVVLSSTDGV
jgi:catechol 2,3-dioxygenase-like lactoylglutathione lyase family enzyme